MFKRVLIVNRGEVANRIISTCLDLGIETVAVYSDDDRSLHYLNRADYAYRIGKGGVSTSYKNIDAVMAVAKIAEVDCVHPGYGFFAEDSSFAKICKANKLEFIGCSDDLLKNLSDKIHVRSVAKKHGIKIIPSSEEPVSNLKDAVQAAAKIGYPVVIKPAHGNHAKGIRRVEAEANLERAFSATQIESHIAFNDDNVVVEKALTGAKHIEVPVLRDKKGNILCLPELDCSIQRRYLKICSETPAPTLIDKQRKYIKDSASKLAEHLGLCGLATFEFLVQDNEIYFMEVNPRLTVEHSITEMVTGMDLVRQQFLISAGETLELKGKDISCRGSAMQCRIYAEDPETFEPHMGVVNDMFVPMGPNVRHEIIAHSGWKIPVHYNHMLAKMSVWGNDRKNVITKMTHLLKDYFYSGIITNIPLQRQIFSSNDVLEGTYNVDFVGGSFVFKRPEPPDVVKTAIALAAAIKVYNTEEKRRGDVELISTPISAWRKEIGTGRL
ncbi:MAG: biotin carboxylase N-terminal domain-containing protein [Pseudomonadota bacterium]